MGELCQDTPGKTEKKAVGLHGTARWFLKRQFKPVIRGFELWIEG